MEVHLACFSVTNKHWGVSLPRPREVYCRLFVAAKATCYYFVSVWTLWTFFLFSGWGAVILPPTDRVKLILTQVLASLQALTSSFGYNYLPRSGILSTFVTETPTLPDEINLSYFLTWIFFLPVADLILKAQWRIAAQGLPFTCELGLLFSHIGPPLGLLMWVVPALIDNVI